MTEAEVLTKLASYKDAIVGLKSQRDDYKAKYEALQAQLSGDEQSKTAFMANLENSLEEINILVSSEN